MFKHGTTPWHWLVLESEHLGPLNPHHGLKSDVLASASADLITVSATHESQSLSSPSEVLAQLFPSLQDKFIYLAPPKLHYLCETLSISATRLLKATLTSCTPPASSSSESTCLSSGPAHNGCETSPSDSPISIIFISTVNEMHQTLSQLQDQGVLEPLRITRASIAMELLCNLRTAPLNPHLHPLLLLIGGTSGSGKSTVALELQNLLGLVDKKQLLSSDEVRDEMRHSYPKTHLIWRSTYNVADVLCDGTEESKKQVLDGFEAQSRLVEAEVASRIDTPLVRTLVVEGVHVTPLFAAKMSSTHPNQTMAFFLRVPDADDHRNRFVQRGPKSTPSVTPVSNAADKYFHYFDNIRCISDYITNGAAHYGYHVIDNCELGSALCVVLRSILDALVSQQS